MKEIGGNMNLGDRIKKYEKINRHYALARMPLIIRVDGRAFHTLTKNFRKPFDDVFINAMLQGAIWTSEHMHGFKCAYVQSDEVSFLLTDYDTINTQGWYDYNIQKITSVTASLMTIHFNRYLWEDSFQVMHNLKKYPVFDARVFNVPIADAARAFLWRAKDWHKNSIQMYARSFFSHKELHKKTCNDMLDMLRDNNSPWEDISNHYKNGYFIIKDENNAFKIIDNIRPNFEEINALIKPLITFE